MKRVLEAGAVVVASFAIALGVAGPAAAQEPFAKYPTKAECIAAGNSYVQSDHAENFDCSGPHAGSSASAKWWLYLI